MDIIKKINTKNVGLGKRLLEDYAEEVQADKAPVMRVVGTVHASKGDVSQHGPYIKFYGDFEATNLLNGEEFRAPELLLPPVAEMIVDGQLNAAISKAPEGARPVAQIALDVTVTYQDSENTTRFTYGAIPLLGMPEHDPIAELKKSLPAPKMQQKQIASPKKNGKK